MRICIGVLALGLAACGGPLRDGPDQRAQQAISDYALLAVSERDAGKVGECGIDSATTDELIYLSKVDDPTRDIPADIINAILTRTQARDCMMSNGVSWR